MEEVVDAAERRKGGVDLEDDLVGNGEDFGSAADTGTEDEAAVLGDLGDLNDGDIEATRRGVVLGVESPGEVLGEHGEVLVGHLDLAGVDAVGNVLAGLIRETTREIGRMRIVKSVQKRQDGGETYREIISSLAQRSSVSAPTEAPMNNWNLSFSPVSSTLSARAMGTTFG